jgi:formate dehydrogenase subunit gamma
MSNGEAVTVKILGSTAAGQTEDFVRGELVVRHSLAVRVMHWWVTLFFILAFLSGSGLFSPRFFFLTDLFGGGYATRQLHPWFSILFIGGFSFLFVRWVKQMAWVASDTNWIKNFNRYMRYEEVPDTGKFNPGQKLFFWAASLGGLALLLTGVVIWFPTSFPLWLRFISYPLHETVFIFFAIAVIYHFYISALALGGTLRAMTRGTVTRTWAVTHHARWYEEIRRK